MVITKLKKDMAILEQKVRFLNIEAVFFYGSRIVLLPELAMGVDVWRLYYQSVNRMQVVQLTRLRRPSTQKEDDASKRFPFMADNILYDMESTTSPSASSDSDSSPGSRSQSSAEKFPETATVNMHYASGRIQDEELEKALNFPAERVDRPTYSRPGSPLGETSTNQKLSSRSSSMRLRQLQSASGDSKRSRPKQAHCVSRTVTSRKGRS